MIYRLHTPCSRIAGIALLVAAALAMGHWSLRTLAELQGGLQIEFRHTLAVFIVLLLTRWVLAGHRREGADSPQPPAKD